MLHLFFNHQAPGFLPALLFALGHLGASAQTLTNNGSTIAVQPGALLFVSGGVLNQAGTFANNGTVQLTGDFTNAASLSGGGLLRFSGSADQTLTLPNGASLANVEVNNTGAAGTNRLLVPNDLTVTGQLNLSNGLVRTAPAATISLPNGAILAGEAPGRYVQGNLKVVRNVVTSPVDFGLGATLDGTGQNLGTVSITRSAGLNTADLSYGQNVGAPAKQGIDRIWTVQPTAQPTVAVPLTLSWLADDDHGLTNFTQAQLWQQPATGSAWVRVDTVGNGTTRTIARSSAVLNRFTISTAANQLPVELVSFRAELQGADGLLHWAMASARNNGRWEVESSADGYTFNRLGPVADLGTISPSYDYTDANLARYAAAVVYYRLRQVDRNGTETFSPVQAVTISTPAGFAVEAFPNPLRGTDQLNLRVCTAQAGPATLRVTDALGRVLLHQTLTLNESCTTLALALAAQWPQGLYLLRLEQGGQQQTARLVRE